MQRIFIMDRLIACDEGDYKAGCQHFSDCIKLGETQWRVHWYLAKAAHKINDNVLTKNALTYVLKHAPKFIPAQKLLKSIDM